jgi:hypothetical protein
MVSLIRCSFEENSIDSISKKIRHFYDLYFLMNDAGCVAFVKSGKFKEQFDEILQHDKDLFVEPSGWKNKSVAESPLLKDFETIWKQLKVKCQTELSALACRTIPDEESVAKMFRELIKRIQ